MLIVMKSLNNNMVLVRDETGQELIVQGKGLGFQKKKRDQIDESKVERRYLPGSAAESRHFQQLFSEIPDEYWAIAEDVVNYGRHTYGLQVSDKVILPLCDHMAGAVTRYERGEILTNPMLWDIKRVYPQEFQTGLYALKLLQERYGVQMREDEAAFLAYHFVNAQLDNQTYISPDESAKLISSVIDIVQESFQIHLDETDWNYQRFLTHLKFFANRIFLRQQHDASEEDELFAELAKKYSHVLKCVERIADFILIEYHYEISTDEKFYLLIHITRVVKRYL